MRVLHWLRPPRHLLALFGVVTLLPAATLIWLGWQLIEQERGLERQQVQERLNGAADRVATGIARDLDGIARDLGAWQTQPPASLDPGAAVVTLGPNGVFEHSGAPLVFVPGTNGATTMPIGPAWDSVVAIEVRRQDAGGAAQAYRALVSSSVAGADAQAAALVGLARNLRKLGQHDEALAAYAKLKTLKTARVMDEPADLVARAAACQVLAQLGRREDLAKAATDLQRDLASGRWPIDRGTYEMRTDQLRQWATMSDTGESVAIARAVESFWSERQAATAAIPAAGRRAVSFDGQGVLLVWQPAANGVRVFVAGSQHLTRTWRPLWTSEHTTVSFLNPDGGLVLGEPARGDEPDVIRSTVETGLPWTLRVADASTVDSAAVARRRALMAWGLAALVFLIPAGGYVVARAVQKELAVARLQAEFVSAVSHEFRSPLTSMAHLTERLQRDPGIPDDRKRQYYDAIAKDTDRLRRFVETLLDFGRMEAGTAQVHLRPADLMTTVTDVVNEFRTDAAAGRHEISISVSEPVPPVRLDREAFSRALWNLLDNACKYSPGEAPISVELAREARHAAVRVRDNGTGIPAAERRQVFQNFVRGAESRTSGVRGTGVGLAMVARIIKAHGGEIRLESEVGAGSTFSLLLPVEDRAAT